MATVGAECQDHVGRLTLPDVSNYRAVTMGAGPLLIKVLRYSRRAYENERATKKYKMDLVCKVLYCKCVTLFLQSSH